MYVQREAEHVVDTRPAVFVIIQHRHAEAVLGQVRPLVTAHLQPTESVCTRRVIHILFIVCTQEIHKCTSYKYKQYAYSYKQYVLVHTHLVLGPVP